MASAPAENWNDPTYSKEHASQYLLLMDEVATRQNEIIVILNQFHKVVEVCRKGDIEVETATALENVCFNFYSKLQFARDTSGKTRDRGVGIFERDLEWVAFSMEEVIRFFRVGVKRAQNTVFCNALSITADRLESSSGQLTSAIQQMASLTYQGNIQLYNEVIEKLKLRETEIENISSTLEKSDALLDLPRSESWKIEDMASYLRVSKHVIYRAVKALESTDPEFPSRSLRENPNRTILLNAKQRDKVEQYIRCYGRSK